MKLDLDAANLPERRAQPGRVRAIVLAVIVHIAFLALIVFGVSWQSAPVAPLQAQLWDKLPTVKNAPAPAPPKAAPTPPPKPQPAPPPKPAPVPPKPVEAKPPPPKPDPAIAEKAERLKREQQMREEQARKQREEAEAAQRKAEEAAKKKQQEEAAKKKQQQEEALRQKREEEKRQQEAQRAREQAAAEAQRARVAAATAHQLEVQKWVDRIRAKILSRANVPDTVPPGTELNVRIRILPGGDVLDFTVTSSTNPTYRAAIERAIRSASPLPVPEPNSELFPEFRDLNVNFKHER